MSIISSGEIIVPKNELILPFKKRSLILDIDETIIPGEQLMDRQVIEAVSNAGLSMPEDIKKICLHSTWKYLKSLETKLDKLNNEKKRMQNEGVIYGRAWEELMGDIEHVDRVEIPEHYKCKDIVREEQIPEVKGLINYRKIYIPENLYPGIFEILWFIYEERVFDEDALYASSNTNSISEENAKDLFFLECGLPPIETFYDRFHKLPHMNADGTINENREPSNKVIDFVEAHPEVDIQTSSWVDNSRYVRQIAKSLGFDVWLVGNERCDPDNPEQRILPCKAFVDAYNQIVAQYYSNEKRSVDVKRFVKVA